MDQQLKDESGQQISPTVVQTELKLLLYFFLYFIFVLENQMSALEETQTWPRTSLSLGTQQAAADLH